MSKIYCVEDDSNIRELILYTLNQSGFEAVGFDNGYDFFRQFEAEPPNMVLLDIMLPDMDGMEILRKIRVEKDNLDVPIIMLTAKTASMDKVKGLNDGADDYITKPFDVLELVSRINAVLRRTGNKKNDVLKIGKIVIETEKRKVTVDNKIVALTYKEFELLRVLVENKGKVLTREKLMSLVWETDVEFETRTVDVHIRTLRQKLGDCGEYIETVRNVGYKIEENV